DIVVVQDATAQQRAEQGARFLMSDLSHELRTPLAILLTHLEVLRLPALSAETREQSLHLMQVEARRMSRLVNSLLELGRLETSAEIEQRPVELLPLAEEVVAQVAPQAEEKSIRLSLHGDAPLPPVVGDADRLRQLLLILLDNALKYSQAGADVTVRLDHSAEGVSCEVRDTGPGIPAEHLPYLTRRFYRANQSETVPGSGLGLALAAEILHRHGSQLMIESRSEGEDTGTRVRFVLPVVR
ncbi:MAG: sensor histidine kinase, partial [Ardenticatenaceae bacterium]